MRRIVDRDAYASLFFSRVAYAINWYNLAALYTFIGKDFHLNVSGLGIATVSFYVGVGLFQVPGGILAAKYGATKVAVVGTMMSSLAVLLTAVTSQFYQLVFLRFVVGIGMALFFGPGVTLIARTFRRESEGFGVGTFQSAFYVGALLGLFAWSVLGGAVGWRMSLGLSGGLGVVGSVLLLLYVPADVGTTDFKVTSTDLRRILSDKWLVLLSLELFGVGTGTITISTFLVYYLEQSLHFAPPLAGMISGLTPLCAILASPAMGSLYDRTRKARVLLFSLGITLAVAVAFVALGSGASAVVGSLLAGIGSGSFTVGYLSGRARNAGSKEYESLVVSWVNTIQMLTGLWAPIAFSLVALSYGYQLSWLVLAGATLLLSCVILLGRETSRHEQVVGTAR